MVYTSKDKTRELFVRDGLSQSDPDKLPSYYGNQMSNYSPQQQINSLNRNYDDQNQENNVYKKFVQKSTSSPDLCEFTRNIC